MKKFNKNDLVHLTLFVIYLISFCFINSSILLKVSNKHDNSKQNILEKVKDLPVKIPTVSEINIENKRQQHSLLGNKNIIFERKWKNTSNSNKDIESKLEKIVKIQESDLFKKSNKIEKEQSLGKDVIKISNNKIKEIPSMKEKEFIDKINLQTFRASKKGIEKGFYRKSLTFNHQNSTNDTIEDDDSDKPKTYTSEANCLTRIKQSKGSFYWNIYKIKQFNATTADDKIVSVDLCRDLSYKSCEKSGIIQDPESCVVFAGHHFINKNWSLTSKEII